MAAPMLKVSHVRKIALLRANGLGDLIFALPAVQALRLAYPDAEIIWLGLDLHRQFFLHRPGPWCGNFINASPMTRARHRAAISWLLACPVCGGHCLESQCQHAVSFVADVTVTEVIASALDLLKQASGWRRSSAPAISEDFACG